jgi:hypothetical protein
MKGFINIALKGCGWVYESEGNNQEFKKIISSLNSSFSYIFILYPNETIDILNVDFGNIFHLR